MGRSQPLSISVHDVLLKLPPFRLSISSLAGSQLLVSLTGGHHFVYDPLRPHIGPTRWFGGHTGGARLWGGWVSSLRQSSFPSWHPHCSLPLPRPPPPLATPSHTAPAAHLCPLPACAVASFYVKAAWSPDGSHIISGSTDRSVYIWEVRGGTAAGTAVVCWGSQKTACGRCAHRLRLGLRWLCVAAPGQGPCLTPALPPPSPPQVDAPDGASPYVLPGHQGEVTAVAWCPSDFQQVRAGAVCVC